MAKYTYRVTAL